MTMDTIDISICQDCLVLVANGDGSGISDVTSHLINMDRVAAQNPGMMIVPGDEDLGFCTSRCDSCGDPLHGDRYRAHLMPR